MGLVIVPEVILLDIIDKAIAYVRKNYADASDKTRSWLGLAFNGQFLEKYDMFKEITAIICNRKDDPRYFAGDLMFNPKKNGVPSFHITMPSESPSDGNTIGMGQQSSMDDYTDVTADEHTTTTVVEVYSRRMQTNYSVVVVSDNSIECVMLYHFMRAILIANNATLVGNGLEQIVYAGADLQPYQKDLDSHPYFMKSVSLGIQYTTSAPSMTPYTFLNEVEVAGLPIEEE